MTQVIQRAPTQLSYLSARPTLPMLAQMAIVFAVAVTEWSHRKRTRRQLSELDAHMLNDIGLTRSEARAESTLPFWRP